MQKSFFAFLLVLAGLATIAQAQQSAPALGPNVSEHKLASKLMGRDMPYRVIVPVEKMVATGTRHPVIYLLHGLTGHFNNWTDLTKLSEYAAAYNVIIVMPEGGDGWYTDSVSNEKEKWESYIVQELIPEVDKKFKTQPTRDKRAIAGLSMGGFGSLKFGLKYPEKFVLAGSFSGAVSAGQITEKTVPGAIGKTIDGIFGPEGSENRKANDVIGIIRSLTPEKTKEIPFIYFDCGTEDFLFQSNRDFVNLLVEKKVPHEYRQLPGVHDWKYWDKQVQEFLRLADKFFAGTKPAA
jgi:S-formylglutathione hydrolase FrmB